MMTHTRFAMILYWILCISYPAFSQDDAGDLPNIILIMADDLGIGDVGYTGYNPYVETSALDHLAASGIRFDRFYSQAPVCSPTRASVLTGRHPFRYGIFEANVGCLRTQETTITQLLSNEGYQNGHFGKWHLGLINDTCSNKRMCPADPFSFGYHEYFATHHSIRTYDPNVHYVENGPDSLNLDSTYIKNGIVVKELLYGDDSQIIMDEAIDFIETNREDKFFTTIWFHTPHKPVKGGPDLVAYYKDKYPGLSESQCNYYAAITGMDNQIGRLVDSLEKWGIANNTMLWFCSDNGPTGNGRTGIFKGAKRHLFEGGIRVPGILVWPEKIKRSRIETAVATTSDYFPTILDAIGSEHQPLQPLDGESLMPVIQNQKKRRSGPLCFQSHGSVVCLTEDYKLMQAGFKGSVNLGLKTGLIHNKLEWMLFDMHQDSMEAKNIIANNPEVADSLRHILKSWMDTVYLSFTGADYPPGYSPDQSYRFKGGVKGEKEQDLTDNRLGAIYIDQQILRDYDPNLYHYSYERIEDAPVTIYAFAAAINAKVDTIILPFQTDSQGGQNTAKIDVSSASNSIATYQVEFNTVDPDSTTYLENVKINGNDFADFHPYKTRYYLDLADSIDHVPVISATAFDTSAIMVINHAEAITNAREEKRSTVITTISSDQADTLKYTFIFSLQSPSSNTFLELIEINGTPLRDFSPYLSTYNVEVPDSGMTYVLKGIPMDNRAHVKDDLIEVVKGSSDPFQGTIQVIAPNGFAEWNYHVYLHPAEEDATDRTETSDIQELKAYPNPCENVLHLSTASHTFTVEIYDITGKIIKTLHNEKQISTGKFDPGIYFLAFRNHENQSTKCLKFTK